MQDNQKYEAVRDTIYLALITKAYARKQERGIYLLSNLASISNDERKELEMLRLELDLWAAEILEVSDRLKNHQKDHNINT